VSVIPPTPTLLANPFHPGRATLVSIDFLAVSTMSARARSGPVLPATCAASNKDNDSAKEQANHGSEASPHSHAVKSMGAAAILVDMILDDPKDYKVNHHNHQRDDPRYDGDDAPNEPSNCPSQGTDGSNESKSACDGMQNEDIRERVGRISTNTTEARAVNLGHDLRGLIPNDLLEASILIRGYWSHIENAVAEGAEGDRGVA